MFPFSVIRTADASEFLASLTWNFMLTGELGEPLGLAEHLLVAEVLHPSGAGSEEVPLLVPRNLLDGKLGRSVPRAAVDHDVAVFHSSSSAHHWIHSASTMHLETSTTNTLIPKSQNVR